jgi:signal transduction histidine kinase
MAALMTHDLEGPLASMKTVLKLLENGTFKPEKELHQRLVKSTRIAVSRSESIIHDLMTAARMEVLEITAEIVRFDILPVLHDSLLMASAFASENGIEILFQNAPNRQIVLADKDLVARVADNLLYNAVRHTPAGGKISLGVKRAGDTVTVTVTDNGPGLGDIDPDSLFQKYHQQKTKDSKRHRGVGLGLYFCRLAAQAMNGKVWAENDPEGGSKFSFTVPAGGN